MKKTIYYWSPCLTKIATIKATMNSAVSLAKYSNSYEVKIIDVCGEWSNHKKFLTKNNVCVHNLTFNYFKFLPKTGYLQSRVSNFIIILISIFPLMFFMKNKKPDYFIIHLITSLPLFLSNFINTKTNIILRISGFPKLNIFRKKLWSLSEKSIFKITCPTNDLKDSLIEKKIFDKKKIIKLSDPVINMRDFIEKKRDKSNLFVTKTKGYFIAAGRLTVQKNFIYLINVFKKFLNVYPNEKLLIFGEGELRNRISREIRINNITSNVKLCGYKENIYKYMINSKAFILSSLWEDPGFVMIESALCNSFIISSDCKNGPKEFLLDGKAGLIFKSNEENQLYEKLNEFKKLKKKNIYQMKILAKKNSMKFTMFRHFLSLRNIIENKQHSY